MEEDGKEGKSCYDELSKRDKMAPEVEPKGKKKPWKKSLGLKGSFYHLFASNSFKIAFCRVVVLDS